jgi:hypothetical protein
MTRCGAVTARATVRDRVARLRPFLVMGALPTALGSIYDAFANNGIYAPSETLIGAGAASPLRSWSAPPWPLWVLTVGDGCLPAAQLRSIQP